MKEKYKGDETEVEVINPHRIETQQLDKLTINSYLRSFQLSSINARKVNQMDRRLFGETCAHR